MMKRLFTIFAFGMATLGATQDIDPTKIYDRLDASRYITVDPLTGRTLVDDHQSAVTTQIILRASVTNYVRIRDGQMMIEQLNISPAEAIDMYRTLGGTNMFDTNDIMPLLRLNIRVGPTTEANAVRQFGEDIYEALTVGKKPQQGAGVVREPRGGSRAPQP